MENIDQTLVEKRERFLELCSEEVSVRSQTSQSNCRIHQIFVL
jgi:hypothetical protein